MGSDPLHRVEGWSDCRSLNRLIEQGPKGFGGFGLHPDQNRLVLVLFLGQRYHQVPVAFPTPRAWVAGLSGFPFGSN